MAPKKQDDFDAQDSLKKVGDDLDEVKRANEGVAFEEKVKEAVRRSADVQTEIRHVVWVLFKEKIAWIVLGAFSFALLEILKVLAEKLISKI